MSEGGEVKNPSSGFGRQWDLDSFQTVEKEMQWKYMNDVIALACVLLEARETQYFRICYVNFNCLLN